MTDVTIRPLAAGDRAGWDALWKGYLAFYESAVPGEVTETTWARLIDPADDPYGYCAVDASGRLIGIVHYLFHRSTWTTSCSSRSRSPRGRSGASVSSRAAR